jgi:dTDP-4-amino-4,6-dideoxygalactose transaminase
MIRFKDGYVVNPDVFWRPAYRISPFNTSYIRKNKTILSAGKVQSEIFKNFFGDHFFPCLNGRSAIGLALSQYNLQPDDEILILTTSGNTYISSCVTNEISQRCRWSTSRSEKTKLVFVNHEFGFCYQHLKKLKEECLPIVEDRALSFASTITKGDVGITGDFVIYSLPKYFPVSFGGVLQCNDPGKIIQTPIVDKELEHNFAVLMSHYLPQTNTIKVKRKENYNYLKDLFEQAGFAPFFNATDDEAPGVFMFRTNNIDLNRLKVHMQNNGVESSVFYGKEAFFLPVHQELRSEDMDFLFLLVTDFIEHGDK